MRQKVSTGLLAGLFVFVVLALGCAFLMPLFSFGQTVFPSLFSVVLTDILIAGALFSAYLVARAFSGRHQEMAGPVSANPPKFWGGLLAVFLCLAAAIGLTGYFYNRHQMSQQMEATKDTLASIADLKVSQISNWYQDLLTDMRTIHANSFIQDGAARYLAVPSAPELGEELFTWFSAQADLKHRRVLLYDAQGTMRLSAPPDAPAPKVLDNPDFKAALHARDVVVTDLHSSPDSGQESRPNISLDLWIPMRGTAAGEEAATGVLLVQVDPFQFLYPLIQSWPTDSPTAETLLVRREGKEIVYLNELRHRRNTALALRLPMEPNPLLPAVLAVQGREGFVEAPDYRGVPALAVLRGIPDTPWFMVSKMDRDEIRGPMRQQTWITIVILVVLILASALGMGFLGRHRDNEWLRQQLAVEQERQAFAERYVLLNKHANDIILMTDRNGMILEANDRALEAYGYSPDEMRNLAMKDLRASGKQHESTDGAITESLHRRRDGSLFPVEISTHSIEIGDRTFHQSIIRDITDRKRAEQELHSTRDYLESLLDCANAPIIVWDPDFRITRFNHAFERLAGQGAKKVIGQHLSMLFPADSRERLFADIARTSAGERWESVEIPIVRKDGNVRVALWNSANLYGEDGKTLVATIAQGQDITERKRAAEELEQTNAELERKNQELEQVVYVASHDLRSPLVNVQGFSTELKAALDELRGILEGASLPAETRRRLNLLLAEDLPESLSYILSGIAKMDTLISGLLRLSRLGRVALTIGPVDMNELAVEVARLFEFQIQEGRVALSIAELPPCLGDAAQLNQAFSNLLGNALKYLDPVRPGVVRITGTCENGQSVYCVEDNGIGIAEQHQKKIFNLYHRLNPGASHGEGMGLTIVRTVLERQHGKVWLESEPGVGSRFYVSLPGTGKTGVERTDS